MVLAAPAEASFVAGGAKVPADPPQNICLGGYGSCPEGGGRTMTHVRDPLYARALAFGDARGGALIIVHTTNIGLFASYKTVPGVGAYHIRQAIAKRTGVPADHVIVQSDHSHAGPDTIGIWGGVPTWYLKQLQKAAVDAGALAWQRRRNAVLRVGTADGPGITSSYASEPNLETDDEFRLLWADSQRTGKRIATLANYSPHATVLGSSNKGASGDWPEWAARLAETRFGGTGMGSVGTLGREDFGASEDGDAGEAQARSRLEALIAQATADGALVRGRVDARTTFITEPIGQPILLANLIPEGTIDAGGYDLSIDRDIRPPWLNGSLIGTYAGAARIGDVFLGVAPGESFPELQQYLRDEGGVTGARVHFHLGASNDFLGYMLRPLDHYPQVASEGAFFLAGCPEEQALSAFGVPYDNACTDHWTLMVSPTIGTHVACTIQKAALKLRFTAAARDPACGPLTAADGVGAPPERR